MFRSAIFVSLIAATQAGDYHRRSSSYSHPWAKQQRPHSRGYKIDPVKSVHIKHSVRDSYRPDPHSGYDEHRPKHSSYDDHKPKRSSFKEHRPHRSGFDAHKPRRSGFDEHKPKHRGFDEGGFDRYNPHNDSSSSKSKSSKKSSSSSKSKSSKKSMSDKPMPKKSYGKAYVERHAPKKSHLIHGYSKEDLIHKSHKPHRSGYGHKPVHKPHKPVRKSQGYGKVDHRPHYLKDDHEPHGYGKKDHTPHYLRDDHKPHDSYGKKEDLHAL